MQTVSEKTIITEHFLNTHPTAIFVFGDNVLRLGHGGAAKLRDHPQSYGFITKKLPTMEDSSFFSIKEYEPIFSEEVEKMFLFMDNHPGKIFYISKIGAGLANRFGIWEKIIRPRLPTLISKSKHTNRCVLLWGR